VLHSGWWTSGGEGFSPAKSLYSGARIFSGGDCTTSSQSATTTGILLVNVSRAACVGLALSSYGQRGYSAWKGFSISVNAGGVRF